MHPFRAVVRGGKLVVDEPTDLPEGAVVELVPLDDVLAVGDDALDDEERERLHQSLDRALEEGGNGRTVAVHALIERLRARATGR